MNSNSPQDSTGSPPTPRKRGAQPGNTNALTHGYYSDALKSKVAKASLSKARQIALDDLSEEIGTTRQRLFAALDAIPDKFEVWSVLVRTLVRAVAVQFAMRPTAVQRLEDATDEVIADMAALLNIAAGD